MSSHSHLLVQQLLQAEAAAERRARWEASDAQTLELEIAKYKQALAGVLANLRPLGACAAPPHFEPTLLALLEAGGQFEAAPAMCCW